MIKQKFAVVWLLLFFVSGGYVLGQSKVNITQQDITVRSALYEVEKQTGFSVGFDEKVLNADQHVSLNLRDDSVEDALVQILKNTDCTFTIRNKHIIIVKKETAAAENEERVVSGKITDKYGEPLIGATVTIEGTAIGTVSDLDGNYTITIPDDKAVLSFSYIGFVTRVIAAGNKNVISVVLSEDARSLDEVVVIGYGSMKRKDITTAVSSVSTEDLDRRPLLSAASAIQGKAAGVQVVQPSGEPGSGLSIRVRGATSVQASNEPLYVVDGMPTDNINYMSPNDIESIQVLKDASSAAIYGARAANGVVLITTKRGQVGQAKVKISAYAGVSRLGKKIEALNTEEYKDLMKDLKKYTSTVPNIPEDETRYVDWTDKFFRTGINQNYQISVANGTEKVQYLISGGYTDEKGIVKKAQFNRYNFRANIDSRQTDWLNMSLNFSYSNTKGQWVNSNSSASRSGSILSVINTPPFMQEWDPENPGQYDEMAYGSRILNPLAANAADNVSTTDFLKGSIGFTIDLYKGLKFKSTFGIDLNNGRWYYYMDPKLTSDGRASNGRAEESFSRNFEWLVENLLMYDFSKNKHNLSFVGGSTQQRAQSYDMYAAGFDMSTGYSYVHSLSGANQIDINSVSAAASAWAISSFLGRVAYNYDSRYLFTANFRADGSSRFAPGHRWGYFPAFSAGWRVTGEEFMKPVEDQINDMKIRIGWGMNGNQAGIGNYAYYAGMSRSRILPTTDNLYPGFAITPYSGANVELTWEKTSQWNAGLDLMLFKSRLSITLDAYYKRTTDLLLTISLPDNVNLPGGFPRNDGEMINKGMELLIMSQNIKGDFNWDTDFNISFNRNQLTKLGLNKVYYYGETYATKENVSILKEGLPLGSFFGYVSEGVDPETGDIIYTDFNENGETDPGDRRVIGCAQPDFIYGMTNTFSYKGISLSVFLQGSYGNDIFNASRIDTEGMVDFANQSKRVLDRWKRPGMITDVPRGGNPENIHNSTRFLEDGSFLRLKNITLSYDFNPVWLAKMKLSRLQIYGTAQNLLTFTKYTGYDPEVNYEGGSAVVQGVDYGTYPQSKSFVFGLNVEF